jgi:hypothetical protein
MRCRHEPTVLSLKCRLGDRKAPEGHRPLSTSVILSGYRRCSLQLADTGSNIGVVTIALFWRKPLAANQTLLHIIQQPLVRVCKLHAPLVPQHFTDKVLARPGQTE